VRLAPISAFALPLSIFSSPVLNSVVEQPSVSAVSVLAALLLSIFILGAWGWYWIFRRDAARQRQIEELSDISRLGDAPSAQRLLVIRAVDDEAYLVMALGTILTHIFTTLIALFVVVLGFLSSIVGVPLSYILLHYSTLPSEESRYEHAIMLETWYRHAFTFGCSAFIIAMFGALIVSRLVHGRELANSPMDCQINTQSAPDAAGLKIVTLVSHNYVKWFGRHGIYEHDDCAKAIADWTRARLRA
jgi:hypothetical protein